MRQVVLVLFLLSVAGGCGGPITSAGGNGAEAARLQVVTSVAPITSIVAGIAGDRAEVAGIIPEGTNSHTYDPPPSTAALLARADVVVLNGLKLEEPTLALAEANRSGKTEILLLGDRALTEEEYVYDFSFPREGGKPNPHTWTNPPLAVEYAQIVTDTLSDLDPEGTTDYQRNLTAFRSRAELLDEAMRKASATVPVRKLLTYHDAYAYFARTYGWEVIGAIQVADFGEPTPQEVARLIRQIQRERVPAIFGSEVFPSPVLEQIGREAGVRYVDELRDDDLPGEPGSPEHSWLGLMRLNFTTMVGALGGETSALDAVPLRPALADSAEYPQ